LVKDYNVSRNGKDINKKINELVKDYNVRRNGKDIDKNIKISQAHPILYK
jgi:hypothetical protein